eukprot:6204700-Pleurochrysis_carterae.AAC.1
MEVDSSEEEEHARKATIRSRKRAGSDEVPTSASQSSAQRSAQHNLQRPQRARTTISRFS